MPPTYRHTQVGALGLMALAAGLAAAVWIGVQTGWSPVVLLATALVLAFLLQVSSLTVEIDRGVLECRFGAGLIRKRIALEEIRDARPVRNRWYWGWGIRYTPRGWLFNVSGLDAVELALASGKTFRIGTDEPAELTAAIRRAIG